MTSNAFQSKSPPTPGQSQIDGWTVLEPRPSPTNDSEDSDTAEEDIPEARKRKAKNPVSSSRAAKSPRISGGNISAGASRPIAHPRHSIGSVHELGSAHAGPSNNNSTLHETTVKANISVSQPKASGSRPRLEKRNFPPVKSSIARPSLLGSKSVPSLRQGISSSQPIFRSRPADRARSSSSDSLPDPIALLSASINNRQNVTGGKGKGKASESIQRGIHGASWSSVLNSKNSSTSQKRFLPRPRSPVRNMVHDDDLIVISSGSDDELRAFSTKSIRGRHSLLGRTKEQPSKTYLINSDGAIDLTSDTDSPTVVKSQSVTVFQAKSRGSRNPDQRLSVASGSGETVSRSFPSTALATGVTSQSQAASDPSSGSLERPSPPVVADRPLPAKPLGTQGGRSAASRVLTSRSASNPQDAGPSGPGLSSKTPADTSLFPSSADILSSLLGGNRLETEHARPRYSLPGPSRDGNHRESSTRGTQINKQRAPVEIIDLCSDSDEVMEVDDILVSNPEPLHPGEQSVSGSSSSDGQGIGKTPTSPRRHEPVLPLPSPQSFSPEPDLPTQPPSSSSANLSELANEGSASAFSDHLEGPTEDMTSSAEGAMFAETPSMESASSIGPPGAPAIDSVHSRDGSVVRSFSPPEYPVPPADVVQPSPRLEPTDGQLSSIGAMSNDNLGETPKLTATYVHVLQQQNAEAGPSTLPKTSTAAPASNIETPKPDGPNTMTGISMSPDTQDDLGEDLTDALVPPVSRLHLQTHSDALRDESPDLLDALVSSGEMMDMDILSGSSSWHSASEHASPAPSSALGSSRGELSESSGPVQHARKTTGKFTGTDESESGLRSDTSEREGTEIQEQEDGLPNAIPSTPPRQVISVKEPDFSKLRADNPNALDDAGSLSDAIQWPAEKIPTELHDMLNHLPINYHHNPQMKYIFESMMEENTAEDEPTSPRIEIYSGQNGPVCPPWEFYYTNRILYGKGVPRSNKKLLSGCDCDGPCDPTSETCACVKRQKGWTGDDKSIKGFLYNKKGKVLSPGYPIFECNDSCECSEECMNRVIQNGRQHQISICLTNGKGWGVYADEKIPRGTYLGIYAGEMLLESEAAERGELYDKYGRTYLFDLDFYYLHSLEADKQKTSPSKRNGEPSMSQSSAADKDDEKSSLYTIDAFHVGNFTRFMNHSCDPNCVITPSYVNEPDLQKPTLTIFTTRDVKKGDELCFSYFGNDDEEEEEEDQVDEHGQKKKVVGGPGTHTTTQAIHRPCLCKAPNCRGKMF